MLNFKLIEKNDIEKYKKYYDYSEAISCDVSLINSYLWRNEFNIKFAIYDDTLIRVYCEPDDTIRGYCMPTGKNVKGAVNAVMADADEREIKPAFVMLTNGQRSKLESLMPSRFEYTRSPENQDYVYLTEDLANMSGKKFHAKRNHISKFYKTYDNVRFEKISRANIGDALDVARKWCAESGINPEEYSEFAVICEAFENYEAFNMRGALLYVGDTPAAMTAGTEISKLAFDVNFEKALRKYDGVYAVICNEFAKTLTEYKYINREEDMGIEGLRKSKLSYNPIIIIDRYTANLR